MYYAPSGRSIDRRRQVINNGHTRFRTRHSPNHRNRKPISDWTVDKDVRSNHGSVETIGECVKLKQLFNSAGSSRSQKERDDLRESTIGGGDKRLGGGDDMNRADWTPANIHAVTFNSAGNRKRDDLQESTIGRGDERLGGGDDTNRADWTPANIHAVTFNPAGSSKSQKERDDIGE
eukprot:scaffold144030_cov69-Attheya_sp.AAC.1